MRTTLMKLLSGIILGAVLALGGTYVYKNYFCPCNNAMAETGDKVVKLGERVPQFALKNQDGDMIDIMALREQGPIVVEWFNKDCPYVKKFYGAGEMQRLQKQEIDRGVTWLRVVSSAPGKQGYLTQEEAKAQHDASNASHTLLDPTGEVGRMFDAKTTPKMYVINHDGVLVYSGAIDSIKGFDQADIPNATNYVVEALYDLREGREVRTPQTTPYGSGVKY
ncbi:MAG: thioredoxin family protein [Magnetococcales bacterium]|nr:thioredoxin family protein [Magnetococcales bacterium]